MADSCKNCQHPMIERELGSISQRLAGLDKKADEIVIQTTRTNGRVTALEAEFEAHKAVMAAVKNERKRVSQAGDADLKKFTIIISIIMTLITLVVNVVLRLWR